MVYEIVWTERAISSFTDNIRYLEENWTDKEIKNFISAVEKKLTLLSSHPEIGTPRNKKAYAIRHTLIVRRVSLIYRVKSRSKRIELLLFWNNYRNPGRLSGDLG